MIGITNKKRPLKTLWAGLWDLVNSPVFLTLAVACAVNYTTTNWQNSANLHEKNMSRLQLLEDKKYDLMLRFHAEYYEYMRLLTERRGYLIWLDENLSPSAKNASDESRDIVVKKVNTLSDKLLLQMVKVSTIEAEMKVLFGKEVNRNLDILSVTMQLLDDSKNVPFFAEMSRKVDKAVENLQASMRNEIVLNVY